MTKPKKDPAKKKASQPVPPANEPPQIEEPSIEALPSAPACRAGSKRRGHNPAFMDPKRMAQFCALIGMGCSTLRAATVIGCCTKTIRQTLRRDPEFAAEMQKAEVKREISLQKRIEDASKVPVHWRAAAWLLERCHPERYGKRPPGMMTPKEVGAVLAQFAEIVNHGIRNVQDRRKVGTELKLLTNALAGQAAGESS